MKNCHEIIYIKFKGTYLSLTRILSCENLGIYLDSCWLIAAVDLIAHLFNNRN